MKNRLWKRLTSACLALLLFCSNAELIARSDASAQAGAPGIGVYNRVLTDESEAPVVYRVRLYQYDAEQNLYTEVPLTQAYDFGDDYLDRDGRIELAKNEGVNFKSNAAFMDFLEQSGVTKLTVEYDSAANSVTVADGSGNPVSRALYQPYLSLDQTHAQALYGTPISYFKGETHWELAYDADGRELIAGFTSTAISPLEVERDWRDRGANRGEQGKDDFTIRAGGSVQTIDDAYFELDDERSNQYYYHYYLPEYQQNGQPIAYTVTSNLADTDNHYHEPSQGQELTRNPEGVYQIDSVGLTDLEFSIEWLDAAKPEAKGTYDSPEFKTYLIDNFTLLDESGTPIPFQAEDIALRETAGGLWSVKIKSLVDIAEDSTAKVYALRPNSSPLPLVEDDASGDCYLSLAANPGVYSADTEQVYEGGTLSILLSGKMDFTGTVEWRDAGANAGRQAAAEDPNADAAKMVIWRYVDTGTESDIDRSAQVGDPIPISGAADTQDFALHELDKYDNLGRPYVYYGKENILIRDEDGADPYAKYYESLTEPQEYLRNGETVYNKLAAKSVYSVDAKWIAAARQGGDAGAVFELQRKDADGNWVPVPGLGQRIDRNGQPVFDGSGNPVMVSASECIISDFRAEAMEILEYFPEVPDYDDNGNRYEYRVVQKSITRRDQNNGPNAITQTFPDGFTAGSSETVMIGQDEYSVVGVPTDPANPYEFDFIYTLVGDINIVMVKEWLDTEPKDHSNDIVQLQIRYLPFGAQRDVVYSPDPDNPDYIYQISSADDWTRYETVPRYDSDGRELEYYVNEIGANRPGYFSTYELVKDIDNATYTYTIQNIPTEEGDPRYIGIRKEWIDDGELEYRLPITIRAQGDRPSGSQQEVGSLLEREQPEEADAPAPDDIAEAEEAAPACYFGDLDDTGDAAASATPSVSENPAGAAVPQSVQASERSGAQRNADEADEDPAPAVHNGVYRYDQAKTVSEGTAWQTYFLAHLDFDYDDSDSRLFTEHMNEESTGDYWNIDEIAQEAAAQHSELGSDAQWIYELLSSSYYEASDSNDVNYVQEDNFVSFQNLVGVYKGQHHYYAVQQIWNPNSTMNGMDGEVVFRNTRIGVVSYRIHFDWKIGDDLDLVQSVTVKVSGNGGEPKEYTIPITDMLQDYYILNLPKYDENGKIIDYQIEEVSLNDQDVTGGSCTFNGKTCVVRLVQNDTLYGADRHTDDLMPITLTNQYVGSTAFTAYKVWHDNSNRYYSRSDLYIKLYRKSSAPGAVEQVLGNEYLWEKDPDDTINEWTYRFESLDRFDERGYPYTYYIRELPLPNYRTVYDNTANPDETLQSVTDAACNGGTIHNYLYDEVVIRGEKLWKNISSKITAENYPIATVRLSVGKYVSGRYVADRPIAESDIYNGETSFNFRYDPNDPAAFPHNRLIDPSLVAHRDNGAVKTDGYGNIVLPKYNEAGVLIKYVLDEQSINGYTFRISNQRIINDYNGGKPVQYTVHKTWDFDGENSVYPDIKLVLTQSFPGKDANGQAAEITFNTYEARLTEANDWTHTFGVQEDLREYAPNGTRFQYQVYEVLSNYDHEEDAVILRIDGDEGLGFVYSSTETVEPADPDTADEFEQYHYTKEITNTYDPKEENFHGALAVSKTWDNKEADNPENETEFGAVKGYTFTLSRRTRKIATQSLFTVTTKDSYPGEETPEIQAADSQISELSGFARSDGMFVAMLMLDENPVTVTVDPNNNSVHVDGLAIYARDAVRYDYIVTEDSSNPAYLPVSPISHRLTDPESFALNNVLNTTDLRVNKRFGASVNGEVVELDSAHFSQYFNENYLKTLEFTLDRMAGDDSDWTPYLTQSGQDGEGALTLTLEEENDQYYYVFHGLPKYNAEGKAYQYRLTETQNGGTLVTTQYSDAAGAYQTAPSPLTPPDSTDGEAPAFTVRNSFPAKNVRLKKIWDDQDNADGMRDDRVAYLVYEQVPEDPNAPTEIQVPETVTAAESWVKTVPLPLYYFNGSVIEGLAFKLGETMSSDMIKYGYVLDPDRSDDTYGAIPEDGILELTNQKEQVDGSITLTKTWTEQDDPWGLQPDTVYFKLYRRCYDSGGVFSEFVGDGLADPSYNLSAVQSPYNQYVQVTEDAQGNAVDAVIAVSRDASGIYSLTIEHLPIGVVSAGGRWYGYLYRFVECDAQGNEYTRSDKAGYSDDGDHFSYCWDYTNGVWARSADDEGMHLTVALTGEDAFQTAHREQGIANRLKLRSYRFEKTWNDENNLYGTRRPITVQLQRRLATQTEEADWMPVDLQSAAPTPDAEGLDHWTAVRSGAADEAVQQVCVSGNTQSGVFDNLPIYNKDGIAYQYRVKELKIGENEIVDGTYNGQPATKTFDYYLQYDFSDPSVTKVRNILILYEHSQHYLAEKIWEDNGNQDGKRPDHLNVYLVQKKAEGQTPASEQTFLGVLNEANDWKYQWDNYPAFDENGDTYTYSMREENPIDSYTPEREVHTNGTIPDAPADRNKWEQNSYTNGHTQAVQSLTVDKDWLNELASEKRFRPESLTYELCCKYTTYRYASYDPVEIVADSSYDGPISGATALLARYPHATWEGDSDTPHYTKTLTPADRTDDEAWENAVTFHNLPVYLNTCGDERWNGKEVAVEYYIREVEDFGEGEWNPYLYGVSSINDTVGTGQSSHTTLLNGSTAADQTVTVQNKFKKREIVVTKIWEDKGYGDGLHYAIDFTLDCTGSNAGSGYSYHETKTLPVGQTSVSFPELPVYDKNGQILNYTLTETVHGSTAACKYGYQQTQTVTYHGDGAEHFVTVFTVTNTLPVVRLSADKYWNDKRNQDGKRPEQLDFSLTGTAEGTEDISLTRSDSSEAHADDSSGTHWRVDFGVQPQYNANNVPYVYSVTEAAHSGDTLASRGYARYVTEGGDTAYSTTITDGLSDPTDPAYGQVVEATEGTIPAKTFHFQNRYSPETDALAVKKQWNDAVSGVYDLASLTRPESVTVTLWCKYGDEDPVELAQAAADHPVKQLFPNGYAFSRTVRSSEDWIKLFENLPRSVNPNGTATFNGQSYPIVYSVTEEVPTGYTVCYSAPTALTDGADDRITVTNTLEQREIPVTKVWNDGGLSADALHYDIDFTLSYSGGAAGVSYSETKTLAADAETQTVIFEDVPLYDRDGHAIPYTVTERVHGGSGATQERRYGYTASQTLTPASPDADHPLTAVTVTNTLPKTVISVSKTWDDAANAYALRPSEIRVRLERRTVTDNGTAWASAEDGWANCGGEAAIRGDTWSHTYAALPKFDANNIPYEYRVTEAKVNAYDTAYLTETGSYQAAPVVKADSASGDNSVISFGVKNTLITEPLTLIKVWDDSGCTQSGLHYPVTFAVSNSDTSRISFQTVPYVLDINETHTTGSADNWRRTTAALPVYYRDGTPILYTVTETSAQHYGYAPTGPAVPATNGTHSGNANYYDSYTITNRLPVTDVEAVKQWAGDLELYPKADATVRVDLSRSVPGGGTESVLSDQAIPYGGSVTFQNLLVFNADNQLYTYRITEQTVPGYTSVVSPETAAAADGATETFTVTNTPILGGAEFVKYDATDYQTYHTKAGFTLTTLPGAVFELHRLRDDDDKWVTVRGGNGVYAMTGLADASGDSTQITSGADGRIQLNDLEPNEYYLQELVAPTGYQLRDTRYSFTVRVNASNTAAELADVENVTEVEDVQGLPNEQKRSSLRLTKQDALDNTILLPCATYTLLRLQPFAYRDSAAVGGTEAAYLQNAMAALTADGSALATYWNDAGTYVTDAYGQITATEQIFGVYAFYEVKGPTGYDRDFTHLDAADPAREQNVVGPVELNADSNGDLRYTLNHLEPRSKANVSILKTDESGEALRGAVFELYGPDPEDLTQNSLLAKLRTGYDGMNDTVTVKAASGVSVDPDSKALVLDPAVFGWDASFWFVETRAPTGYAANNAGTSKERINFTLDRETAEEALHIVRARDARLKGTVTLSKTASAPASGPSFHSIAVGAPLPGASFQLYQKQPDGSWRAQELYVHSDPTNHRYRVYDVGDDSAALEDFVTAAPQDSMTTGADGKLSIEGLLWGDYYLEETAAPSGFTLPTGDAAKLHFTVGRNTTDGQELELRNAPQTAQLDIQKHIDAQNAAAWGKPAFLFRLRQTAYYDYESETMQDIPADDQPTWTRTITVTTADPGGGYTDETGLFDIEPGTYEITELPVARYVPDGNSVTETLAETVTAHSNAAATATLSVAPGGSARVTFQNKLDNYEKQSHNDLRVNSFNGYKALRLDDKYILRGELSAETAGSSTYSVTVPKADLLPRLVRADGSEEAVSLYADLTISCAESEITVNDQGNSITVSGRIEDLPGSVYSLSARYKDFTASFALRFEAEATKSRTETRVVFRNDADNVSYYDADGGKRNVYTLILLEDGDGNRTALHNGATQSASAASIPALRIEAARPGYSFAQWSYTVAAEHAPNVTLASGTAADSAALYQALTTPPAGAEDQNLIITVTPSLIDTTP